MNASPRSQRQWALLAGVSLFIVAVLWLVLEHRRESKPASSPAVGSTNSETAAPLAIPPTQAQAIENPIQSAASRLKNRPTDAAPGRDPGAARGEMERLRAILNSLPAETASAEIRRFLESGSDVGTHLGFVLSADGLLREAPTLRVFLLDQWARIDSAAAADYAKTIFSSKSSADEWAVSFRTVARAQATAEAGSFLREKFREMVLYEPWQQDPSAGFLEAFDVPVHLGGTDLMPTLSALLRSKENPAVAHAAFLALDRLTLQNPAECLGHLLENFEGLEGREATRANFFARADVTDPRQRLLLERYLLDPRTKAAELTAFAGVYPNNNYMVSQNLLTKAETPSGSELARHDREALSIVEQWRADPRFARLDPVLKEIELRLRGFVGAKPDL